MFLCDVDCVCVYFDLVCVCDVVMCWCVRDIVVVCVCVALSACCVDVFDLFVIDVCHCIVFFVICF